MTTTATFPVTVGDNVIQVTADVTSTDKLSTAELVCRAAGAFEVFAKAPKECGVCNGKNLVPTHRNTKGYDFNEIKCVTCGATLKMGQLKAGGLFIKRDTVFEQFTPKEGKAETNTIELGEE